MHNVILHIISNLLFGIKFKSKIINDMIIYLYKNKAANAWQIILMNKDATRKHIT